VKKTKRDKQTQIFHHLSQKSPQHLGEDNKRQASVAAILQWTMTFCIALCSVDLFGSAVEHGFVFDFVDFICSKFYSCHTDPQNGYLSRLM